MLIWMGVYKFDLFANEGDMYNSLVTYYELQNRHLSLKYVTFCVNMFYKSINNHPVYVKK